MKHTKRNYSGKVIGTSMSYRFVVSEDSMEQ